MAAVRDATLKPKGYQQITSLAAATGLTVPVGGAKYALIKCETQSVRWRDDGTDPTAAIGMLIDVGDEFWYTGDITKIKFIQTTATAVLNVCYYV
jgi:hypothetical protein